MLAIVTGEQNAGVQPISQREDFCHRLHGKLSGLVNPDHLAGDLLLELFICEKRCDSFSVLEAITAKRSPAGICRRSEGEDFSSAALDCLDGFLHQRGLAHAGRAETSITRSRDSMMWRTAFLCPSLSLSRLNFQPLPTSGRQVPWLAFA